ncbi:MAG: DUF192 domain-containing protein [Spirochaetaceae bacterium]|nr:DUF192 domain-containing protein [Spirochaetaceae bacterium]
MVSKPPPAGGRRGSFRYRRRLTVLTALFVFTGALACTPSEQRLEQRQLILEKAGGGEVSIRAEIARTDEDRARGLMYRKQLPDGEGMLFVFDRDRILSFWMKDTVIPLSIAFIGYNGRILEIRDMQPRDLSSIRSGRAARYALEVPQGWFDRVGITAGDRLILDFEGSMGPMGP